MHFSVAVSSCLRSRLLFNVITGFLFSCASLASSFFYQSPLNKFSTGLSDASPHGSYLPYMRLRSRAATCLYECRLDMSDEFRFARGEVGLSFERQARRVVDR